ncbi:RipA family octameric membrane protein [Cylindrospermum sp. FACHB-282]|uniref:RipA family octameric membrane protein n=1 Tax=Cylindrospermum sp. FACHB-282 TaxID=2692794 RepID=UPI001689FEE9|nr:hypothetical protein [Cylindrospermum sp. FACHB-282]MBD2385044.1 hypothetical protein [Cylindrospermum sp. FACHB-282]
MSENQLSADQQNIHNINQKIQNQVEPIDSRRNSYGENFHLHILEEYKLYVEMMDRNTARRGQINTFYISLLSGILALMSVFFDKKILPINQVLLLLLLAVLGLALCFVWIVNINSYKELNFLKFKVINEMEKYLPYPCYTREWEILKEGNISLNYRRLTKVEKYVPFILGFPYFCLLIYSLIKLFTK